jgi:hypothetical protein
LTRRLRAADGLDLREECRSSMELLLARVRLLDGLACTRIGV